MHTKGRALIALSLIATLCGCGNDTTGIGDVLEGTYANPEKNAYLTFFRDGSYVLGTHSQDEGCGPSSGNGVEAGSYTWDAGSGAFSITNDLDTNDDCGLSGTSKTLSSGTLLRDAEGTLTLHWGENTAVITPVGNDDSVVGSYRLRDTNSKSTGASLLVTFVDATHYFLTSTGDTPGIEDGCYTIDDANNAFSVDVSSDCSTPSGLAAIDTNGDAGFSAATANATLARIADDTLRYQDGSIVLLAERVTPVAREHEPHCGQFACP